MVVDYLKKDNYYILKLNFLDGNKEIVKTECNLKSKRNGSIVINDIVDLLSIGIKYQDNNINDYKTETFYNKERTFTDSKSE